MGTPNPRAQIIYLLFTSGFQSASAARSQGSQLKQGLHLSVKSNLPEKGWTEAAGQGCKCRRTAQQRPICCTISCSRPVWQYSQSSPAASMRAVPHVHTTFEQNRLLAEQEAEGFASCIAHLVVFDVLVVCAVTICVIRQDVELQ